MLIFIRWVLKLFEKEHAALARYERSHRHFLWFLALDAVLSVTLVVGGYQLFLTSSSAETLEPQEISLMSADALTGQAGLENMDAFWLGPVPSYKYTINDQQPGIVDIFYWPETTGNSDEKAYLYEVKTYASQDAWNAHTHPIKASVDTTTISVNKNISVKINKSSMRGAIATFADRPEVVAIGYPKPQTLDAMIKNVESLKLAR